MACPIKDEDGHLDEGALRDLVEIGGHLQEAGRFTYDAWKTAMQKTVGDVFNEGDFVLIWKNMRAETAKRRNAPQSSGGKPAIFVDELTRQTGSLQAAADAVNDIVKRTGGTEVLDRFLQGKETPEEVRLISEAVAQNTRRGKGKTVKSEQMARIQAELGRIREEAKERKATTPRLGPDRSPKGLLTSYLKRGLGDNVDAFMKAHAPIVKKLLAGKGLTDAEKAQFIEGYRKVKRTPSPSDLTGARKAVSEILQEAAKQKRIEAWKNVRRNRAPDPNNGGQKGKTGDPNPNKVEADTTPAGVLKSYVKARLGKKTDAFMADHAASLGKLLDGQGLSTTERSTLIADWDAATRKDPAKKADLAGATKQLSDMLNEARRDREKAEREAKKTAPTGEKLIMGAMTRLLKHDGAEAWKADIGESTFRKLADGEELTPEEETRVTEAAARNRPGQPEPNITPANVQALQHVLDEARKREAATAGGILARRLGMDGMERLREQLPDADAILGKISNGSSLTEGEVDRLGRAWLQVERPKPTIEELNEAAKTLREIREAGKMTQTRERNADLIARFEFDRAEIKKRLLVMLPDSKLEKFGEDLAKVSEGDMRGLALVRMKYERATIDNLNPVMKAWSKVKIGTGDIFGFLKNFIVTGDFGMVARHAVSTVGAAPDIVIRNLVSRKTLASIRTFEDAYAMEAAMFSRPEMKYYEKGKGNLELTSINPNAEIENAGRALTPEEQRVANKAIEENTGADWLQKMPTGMGGGYLRGIERAQVLVINRIRMDYFDRLHRITKFFKRGAELSDAELGTIGEFVNTATGRGDVEALPGKVKNLFELIWSPKLQASRVEYLTGKPLRTALGQGQGAVATTLATQYAMTLVTAAIVIKAGLALGGATETDPTSTNFLKLRFRRKHGDIIVDPFGGHQQWVVLASRAWLGRKMSFAGKVSSLTDNKYGSDSTFDVGANFIRGKLDPVTGTAVNIVDRKDFMGRPFSVMGTPENGREDGIVPNMVTPLTARDVFKAAAAEGMPEAAVLGILNTIGVSANYMSDDDMAHKRSGSSAGGGGWK